ncbi:hypothetical protein VTJ83DRAFT_2427 [Remersonia thermophila]|uniref:Uncharacterized protein n=1 Tax=Remersonia thermophila TaxID=72144 RepID=A0ABR4DIQ5_9PEZI
MSADNGIPSSPSPDMSHQRRGSLGTASAFTTLFRHNSVSQISSAPFPTPLAAAAAATDPRRRLSVTTLGLSGTGTSPTTPSALLRRASLSTSSDSFDENAVDDDDASRAAPPGNPFTRRMSFGAPSATRPGARGSISPSATDQGFNWSDRLRSRAESITTSARPSFSFSTGLGTSPPRAGPAPPMPAPRRDRAVSVSDMPAPPAQAPKPRAKPDPFQERILKGDFYMD